MQPLARPVGGTLIVCASRRVYVALMGISIVVLIPSLYFVWMMWPSWQAVAFLSVVLGPIGYCVIWLAKLRVELTNYAITYRTLWRTRAFALAELRQPVVEVGPDGSRTAAPGRWRTERPMVRLVLSPYKHPLKDRVDVNMMQLNPVAMRELLLHLGISDRD